MESIVLLLHFRETEYGRRMLRFLATKKNPFLYPELVTDKERLLTRVGTDTQKIVVLTDREEIKEDGKRKVIYLSERKETKSNSIWQYQKADSIYTQIMELLDIQEEKKETEKGVYGVFSPGGREGAVLAIALAQYFGKKGNCLYMSLSGFPLIFNGKWESEPTFFKNNLGTLLFALNQEDFLLLLQENKIEFGTCSMLAPMRHYKDLLDCSLEDFETLFRRIHEEGNFDYVVVEIGQLFEYTLDILQLCKRAFVMKEQGISGELDEAVFHEYCRLEKKDNLREQVTFVTLPDSLKHWDRESLELMQRQEKELDYLLQDHVGEEDLFIVDE